MPTGFLFQHNGTQAVSLPPETQFPHSVKKVHVRINGPDRIISPAGQTWDSFFLADNRVSDDFMAERSSQDKLK